MNVRLLALVVLTLPLLAFADPVAASSGAGEEIHHPQLLAKTLLYDVYLVGDYMVKVYKEPWLARLEAKIEAERFRVKGYGVGENEIYILLWTDGKFYVYDQNLTINVLVLGREGPIANTTVEIIARGWCLANGTLVEWNQTIQLVTDETGLAKHILRTPKCRGSIDLDAQLVEPPPDVEIIVERLSYPSIVGSSYISLVPFNIITEPELVNDTPITSIPFVAVNAVGEPYTGNTSLYYRLVAFVPEANGTIELDGYNISIRTVGEGQLNTTVYEGVGTLVLELPPDLANLPLYAILERRDIFIGYQVHVIPLPPFYIRYANGTEVITVPLVASNAYSHGTCKCRTVKVYCYERYSDNLSTVSIADVEGW
jgi:hypothetical protein